MSAKSRASKRKPRIEIISSKHIYTGPAFKVYKDIVREGKHTGQRDVVRHTGSVVIMAVQDAPRGKKIHGPRVLLVRQYRYAAGQYLWELPAGRVDAKEKPLVGAKRELLEETGVSAKRWKRILHFYVSPGFLDEAMDIFLAEGLTLGEAQPEEDEQITMRFVPLREVLKWVDNGKIRDAKTIAGVLWLAVKRA